MPTARLALVALLLLGCAHAPRPTASATASTAPALTVTLRANVDDAVADRLVRLARDVEALFARDDNRAEAEVDGLALHVVLPDGMRAVPWPKLQALGLVKPPGAPEWAADFRVGVAPVWLSTAREQVMEETVARLRQRLAKVIRREASVRRDGERLTVVAYDLPANARDTLVQALTVRPRITFHLVDPDAPWMRSHAQTLARGDITVGEDLFGARDNKPGRYFHDLFLRSSDEAPLRLLVDSLHGDQAVPANHRLVVGEIRYGDEHYFRTFFLHRRVELTSEDMAEIVIQGDKGARAADSIAFTLTPWGKQRLAELTTHNVGMKLASVFEPITVHDQHVAATVLSDGVIEQPLTDGKMVLRFPAPRSPQEQLTIDATGMLMQLGSLPAELVEAP